VAVAGYGTSAHGCIGAQGCLTAAPGCPKQLAVGVPCGGGTVKNFTATVERAAAECDATPGCAAFSVSDPSYKALPQFMCQLHPDTIAQSSQAAPQWNVWQKSGGPKPGKWPYIPGGKSPFCFFDDWFSPPPAKPTKPDLVWTTPSKGVTGSMPLGNGKLGLNVWADSGNVVWLLLSHVDALDENTNLDKLGRVKIEAVISQPLLVAQAFKQEMHLPNQTVSIDLTSGVSLDVWVDATTDAVRVASTGAAHKLQATLEIWRNATTGYPAAVVNGTTTYKPPLGCPALHPNILLHPDIVVEKDDSLMFYHRNLEEWVVPSWEIDLKSQQMPPDLPAALVNQTFGGLLSGTTDSKMIRTPGSRQLVSVSTSAGAPLRVSRSPEQPGGTTMASLPSLRNSRPPRPNQPVAKHRPLFGRSSGATLI
jgi:hypothetical protein